MNYVAILVVSIFACYPLSARQQQSNTSTAADSLQDAHRELTASKLVPSSSARSDSLDIEQKLLFGPLVTTLVTAFATLMSAFIGAWSAFKLQDRANARKTIDNQVAAVNRAIFTLTRQWNILNNIYKQLIEPREKDPLVFINMRAMIPTTSPTPEIDFDSLSFMLETDHRQLLADVLLEQERFETAILAMNERAKIHLESVQPRMASAGIRVGDSFTADELEEILGHGLYETLKFATKQAIAQNKKTRVSLLKVMRDFNQAMKQHFPQKSIILFVPKEDE